MGELTYIFGLQIKQTNKETFITQFKYCLEVLKKCEIKHVKSISTQMTSNFLIDKDE